MGFPPEGDILTRPVFEFILTVNIIECSSRSDKLDKVATILFDEGFLQDQKITRLDSLTGMFLELNEFFDRTDRGADELTGHSGRLIPELGEGFGIGRLDQGQGCLKFVECWLRHLDLSDARVLHNKRMQVV